MWGKVFPTSVSLTEIRSDAMPINLPKEGVLRIIEFFLGTCSFQERSADIFCVRNKLEMWRKLFFMAASLTETIGDVKVLHIVKQVDLGSLGTSDVHT